MKLLACQISVPTTTNRQDVADHLGRVGDLLSARLAKAPADLVVLPELSSIDYSRSAFDRLSDLAEDLEGESFNTFSPLAKTHGVYIAFGIPRRENDSYYISQVILGPDGNYIGHYDKLHLAQFGASMEKDYFARGNHLLVFDVNGVRVAPIICYDFRFPELTRRLCGRQRVDLIVHPVAFFEDGSYPSWYRFAVTRALENQVYFLSLNRAGPGFGSSIFCPPWIDDDHKEFVFGKDEELAYLEVERARIADIRKTYSFTLDARENYDNLPVRNDQHDTDTDQPPAFVPR